MNRIATAAILLTLSAPQVFGAPQVRLKELVSIEGVRDNALIGYGVVAGLAGTGDRVQTIFSAQSLTNMLARMGLTVNPAAIQVKNVAAVMVTARLPAFAQPGSRIDVTVSAIGDAPSLQGGVLLMTELKGPDSQVYAVAQGPMVIGGFVAGGQGNSKAVNHPTVGRMPNGATVERAVPTVSLSKQIHLQLQQADFATAARIASAVNQRFENSAHADNSGVVTVNLPEKWQAQPTEFIAEVESLTIEPDIKGRIVVNERTGTIIMGKQVHIAPVAIIQGSLTVEIQTTQQVSQPNALSQGQTKQTSQVDVGVTQAPPKDLMLKDGATVEELVQALNSIGSSPRDIISILQNLKTDGALQAELDVI
jgi:flagellar P-ring protein precursor FlgI